MFSFIPTSLIRFQSHITLSPHACTEYPRRDRVECGWINYLCSLAMKKKKTERERKKEKKKERKKHCPPCLPQRRAEQCNPIPNDEQRHVAPQIASLRYLTLLARAVFRFRYADGARRGWSLRGDHRCSRLCNSSTRDL